jgi:hypothetical protein
MTATIPRMTGSERDMYNFLERQWFSRSSVLGLSRLRTEGGLPFAIPLGDAQDDNTAWVDTAQATDDQLRFYLAKLFAHAVDEIDIDT